MADTSKATAKKAGASDDAAVEVTAAEVDTAPVQGGGDVPSKEAVLTGNEEDSGEVDADDATKAELQEQARERGLDDSGTKQQLADRINEHNEKGVHKPEVLHAKIKS